LRFEANRQNLACLVSLNEEPDEEGEDEKDDVSAGALGLDLGLEQVVERAHHRCRVAGLQMFLSKCFFMPAGRLNSLWHRGQNAGSRDGVFFFPCLKTQRRSGDQRST
jgi:hypothetical protein